MIGVNPYQDVIDWLRSPEGQRWSEDRIERARRMYGDGLLFPDDGLSATLVSYGGRNSEIYLGGVLSVKDG